MSHVSSGGSTGQLAELYFSQLEVGTVTRLYNPWNNGNRHPGWGVAEIQKMSPPPTVGDAADMQLCVIKQGSPPVLENVAFFVTDLLTLARCAVCILNISVGME